MAQYTLLTTRTLTEPTSSVVKSRADNLVTLGLGGSYRVTGGLHNSTSTTTERSDQTLLSVRTLSEPTA